MSPVLGNPGQSSWPGNQQGSQEGNDVTTSHKNGANVAYDMLSVITGMNSHPFVKHVILRQCFSLVTVAYRDKQVQDLKRLCCQATPHFT